MNHFSFDAFKILFFSFSNLITMCFGVDCFEINQLGFCRGSWMCRLMSFFVFGKIWAIIPLNVLSAPCCLSFFSGTSIMQMYHRSLRLIYLFIAIFKCTLQWHLVNSHYCATITLSRSNISCHLSRKAHT